MPPPSVVNTASLVVPTDARGWIAAHKVGLALDVGLGLGGGGSLGVQKVSAWYDAQVTARLTAALEQEAARAHEAEVRAEVCEGARDAVSRDCQTQVHEFAPLLAGSAVTGSGAIFGHLSPSARVLHVHPAEHGRVPSWLGLPGTLSMRLCQAMMDVLAREGDEGAWLAPAVAREPASIAIEPVEPGRCWFELRDLERGLDRECRLPLRCRA